MAHKSVPRDGCGGGAKSCGGNLLVVGAGVKQDSVLRRNIKAVSELVSGYRLGRLGSKNTD
jgi:hypothetical protein